MAGERNSMRKTREARKQGVLRHTSGVGSEK